MTTPIAASACRYCRSSIDPAATRCPHCTSWLSRRRLTGAAAALDTLGAVWVGVSMLAALLVFLWGGMAGGGAGGMIQGIALGVAVLAQGLLIGFAAQVLAGLSDGDDAPKAPRPPWR